MSLKKVLFILAAAAVLAGCGAAHVAQRQDDGKAFVAIGSTMYYCEATAMSAECWPVEEQTQP